MSKEKSNNTSGPGVENTDADPSIENKEENEAIEKRRAFLKAGLIAAPLVLTFKSQPVWALQQMHISGASPWYRGPWNERGDVLKESVRDDGVVTREEGLDPDNILKYRDAKDAPMDWMGPVGGSDESGIER